MMSFFISVVGVDDHDLQLWYNKCQKPDVWTDELKDKQIKIWVPQILSITHRIIIFIISSQAQMI